MAAPAHPYTRSLKLAGPAMAGPRRALQALPDHMPGLLALKDLKGCSFAPRCPIALPECSAAEPPLTAVADGQAAACIRTEMTAHIRPADLARPPAPHAGTPLIAVENLTKRFAARRLFGREQPVTAVDGVSLHPPRSASPSAYVRRKCVAWVAPNAAPAPISLVPSDLWDNEQAICAVPMHPASATLRGADSKVDYPANHRPLGRAQGGEPTPRKAQQRSGSSVPPGDKLAALRRTFRNCRAMSDGRRS
jgi:oligopeptide/dipeptide ABC transporter ATP-binding protein